MLRSMELRALRYFATVVEAGSLTAAAAQLHLSQPSLSVAIGKLETELGVRLLERSPRGVEPTSAGRYLLDAASRLLGDADEIIAALRRHGAGRAGTLAVAAVPALMWHWLPVHLRAHAAAAPEVEVSLVDPPPWTAIDLLQQRRVDLAAILVAEPDRFAARHRAEFDIVDAGEVPLVAALPPLRGAASDLGAGLAVPDPLPIAHFAGARMVVPRRTAAVPSLPEAVEATLRAHGVTPAELRTVETIQTSVPLIEAGLASAILPDPGRCSLQRFHLTVRRIAPEPEPLRALVLSRAGASRDPVIARFLAAVGRSA